MTRQTARILRTLLGVGAILSVTGTARAFDTGAELGASCREFSLNGGKAIETTCGKYLFDWFTEFAALDEERRRTYLEGGPYAAPDGPCFRIEGEISFREIAALVANKVDNEPALGEASASEALQAALAEHYPCPPLPGEGAQP